jgi:hypothetical protein
MTKKEMFTAIMNVDAVAENAEMVEFLQKQIELLDKKSASPKKPTAKQIENEKFKELIVDYLENADAPKCIKEIIEQIPEFKDFSNQKVCRLLTDMVNAKILNKDYVKKTPYYMIAETAENID